MDPDKRNVTAIRLRGEKSDGLFLPISCLNYCYGDNNAEAHLDIGDPITVVNGHNICIKYIPRGQKRVGTPTNGNKTRKKKTPIAPLFEEHADTEQLAYNLGAFRSGDEIEITLKMHGTSQRTAYLPVFKEYKRSIMDRIFRRQGEPVYDWDLVSGTRRTIIEGNDGGYYGSHEFRMGHAELFRGKLWKGETVYYEVVGFTHTGVPIMGQCSNKKLNDKAFVKQYGDITTFSYGCSPDGKREAPYQMSRGTLTIGDMTSTVNEAKVYELAPQSDIYVYRMTMTNEDGNVIEYPPDFMRYRCEQMGVKTVPVFWKGIIPDIAYDEAVPPDMRMTPGDWVKDIAEQYYEGPDPIGETHIREGVVVRIINKPKFCAYKHKNFQFKVLEGIVKADAEAPDMEEADGLEE